MSRKLVLVRDQFFHFSEKNGPILKILFLFTLKISYMMHEEANRLETTQFDFQSHNQ